MKNGFTLIEAMLVFAIVLILGLVFFQAADYGFLPTQRSQAKISNLKYEPEHTTTSTTFDPTTKLSKTTTTHHPARWSAEATNIELGSGWTDISEQLYNKLDIGDRVEIDYVYGRFTKKFYLKQIYRKVN